MDLNGKARREGSSRKQTSLTLLCETSCFEFPHAKWISQKVGFKTLMDPSQKGIPEEEAGNVPCCGGVKFQEVSQKVNPLCQPAFGSLPSKRTREGKKNCSSLLREGHCFFLLPPPLSSPFFSALHPHAQTLENSTTE